MLSKRLSKLQREGPRRQRANKQKPNTQTRRPRGPSPNSGGSIHKRARQSPADCSKKDPCIRGARQRPTKTNTPKPEQPKTTKTQTQPQTEGTTGQAPQVHAYGFKKGARVGTMAGVGAQSPVRGTPNGEKEARKKGPDQTANHQTQQTNQTDPTQATTPQQSPGF